MKIEMNKEYVTKEGDNVQILTVERKNYMFPVVALVGDGAAVEVYTAGGSYYEDYPADYDLIEKPLEIKVGSSYLTRSGDMARVICVDRKNPRYPVVALVESNNTETTFSFTSKGFHLAHSTDEPIDLIKELPKEKEA